ncbi:MAG: polyamine aminopropyltransferase [Chromatiales bacterium]|jgi:spermidine synthase|nr:polyamine aminopropyltransferase [Chromatiales bacterium]MDX9768682.1 polyamine aminopropyltransferase [Ectothiorhodospiraceae bacterium]
MSLDESWFSEPVPEHGTAFSLKIRHKLHEERSAFQKIEVYETETFGNLMVIDGCTMVSTRDNFIYHEMVSHPALFSHPHPRNVLIIGGGDCGTLREVLRHACVETATQVDIDERVTRVSERYFPELCESNGDPRAQLHWQDGIKWVKEAAPGSCDVIIVDSTDPVGPAEGLFSLPFFKDAFRALAPGGLLVQQSESPLLHTKKIIRPLHDTWKEAGFADVRTLHFPQCIYPTGWWTATLACKDAPIRFAREREAENKPFETQYYNADIHRACQATPEFLRRALG